ncbi:MAG: chromosome segregation protein SMC [Clostridiaceae bacterium]|nr:chromosome segregation protein SMC [Clostridiaceae bacterium]
MRLKKLEVKGFKSFANKIEMNFEDGITAVVGPNGSGKSNISDGIKWVLGEQSVKSLRGSKMEDVIFSGTNNRKSMGMAEVSLTLDNSSQTLPVDYQEVTITRRVYRSGESEYYLNKSSCRLKDVREMLMDTGIGKDGYSIIGQGKIDEILSSKSEDRRQLFEEAAGIVKYKHRKLEGEKKLKATKENLLRVTDILQELENQLEPLRKQSIKAQKYKEIKNNLLKLEVNLFIKEIDKIDGELKLIQQQMEMLKKSLDTQSKDKQAHTVKLEEVYKKLEVCQEKISTYQNEFYDTQNYIGKKEGQINLCKEKIINSSENMKRLQRETEIIRTEDAEISNQLEEKLKHLKSIDVDLNKLEQNLEEKLSREKDLNHLRNSQLESLEKSKSYIIDTLNDISEKKSEGNSFKTLIDTMDQRMEQVKKDIVAHSDKEKNSTAKRDALESDLNVLQKDLEQNIKQENEAVKQKNTLSEKVKILTGAIQSTSSKLDHKKSKKHILEEMEKGYEGYNKSVKNILSACEKDKKLGAGIYGVVADLLKVPKGYEIAIETSLGYAIQNIVSESEEDAKRLISYLKKYNLGRVTILPLTSIQSRHISKEEDTIIQKYKDVKIAIDIIDFEDRFKNIFSSLLSRVLIVPNLDLGVKVAKELQYRFKIVTTDGDVMNIGGSLTGGSSTFKGNSLLTRKRELEELTKEIKILDQEIMDKQGSLKTMETSLVNILSEIESLNRKKQAYQIEEATLKSKIQQTIEEITQINSATKQSNREIKELVEAKDTTSTKYNKILHEIKELDESIKNTKSSIEDYQKHLLEEKEKIDDINAAITKDKIELASIKEQKKMLLKEVEDLQATIKNNERKCNDKNYEMNIVKAEYERLQLESHENKNELKKLEQHLNKLHEDLERLKNDKASFVAVENETKDTLKGIEGVINELSEGIHKLDVKATRLEMQQQSFYNKLWDDYELTYTTAKEIRQDVDESINIAKEIKIFKDQLKTIGNVNLQSIEEYQSIKERYEFLKQQKEDLEKAEASLIKVIKDMEATMGKQFIQEFNKIKKHFNEVFAKLFGGGKAQLVLEDEEDLLNCGIEIIAQPPGKKLQNLSLLSGGERALTAIALLFGILLVKPSPFCILDEIEAALDDANISRFAVFLRELSQQTQFIVVTHRRGTMESADALYGVTMEEEGVSKIVSVKFTDELHKEIAS